jgi:replicative DNA helicase
MRDTSLNTALPHNSDAERAVLGGLFMENSVAGDVLSILNADGSDFYHPAHGLIFKTVLSIIDKGSVPDLVTVCDELRNKGQIDKVGGNVFVAEVVDGAITAANIHHYAKIVKGDAIRRGIIKETSKVVQAAYEPTSEVSEILEQAQRSILSLSIQKEKNSTRNANDLTKQTMAIIESRYEQGNLITGISTGLRALDDLTSGLQKSDLIIIAGRPSMGKSALAGNITRYAAEDEKVVAYFSLEMPAESLMIRSLSGHSGIDSRHLRRGFVRDNQWPGLVNAASAISKLPLFIDDKPDLTPMELRAKARRLKADHGLDLLIVDYIQLMRVPGRYDTREQAVAEISRTLKAIARELSIPVIGLSQLNRQVDARTDKHPMLSDLRESGAIEQDADVIAFLYRDEVYNKRRDNPERGFAEIEIAKHRNGPIGTIKLRFDAELTQFYDEEGERQAQSIVNKYWKQDFDTAMDKAIATAK